MNAVGVLGVLRCHHRDARSYRCTEHLGHDRDHIYEGQDAGAKRLRAALADPCPDCNGHGTVYMGDYGTILADECLPCDGTGVQKPPDSHKQPSRGFWRRLIATLGPESDGHPWR